ncbi:MAG: polyketide synthase, partial [Acidobacteria bacterium]|nr:polyketide synthase [Acidobacteriota bacterium]
LAVPLREDQVRALAGEELSLAAVNGPELSIVSGAAEAVDRLAGELRRRGVECRALRTSHAFHSAAMDPIVAPFAALVAAVPRSAPRLPLISNLTGMWMDAATAVDPAYWGAQIREPVRFADGLGTLLQDGVRILLEVGPGQALTALAGQHPSRTAEHLLIASGRHPQDPQSDPRALVTALGRLWIAGAPVSWSGFTAHEQRHRVTLPTYPFERERHWIDPAPEEHDADDAAPAIRPRRNSSDVADWIYVPSWSRRPALPHGPNGASKSWLLFADGEGCADSLASRLADAGHEVTRVTTGECFAPGGDGGYALAPDDAAGYTSLFDELQRLGRFPDAIAHCWSVTRESVPFAEAQERGFSSLMHLSRALGDHKLARPLPISVVATNLFDVRGGEPVHPEKATLLGPCKVIPQERSQLRFRIIDVDTPAAGGEIAGELTGDIEDTVVAYRGRHRWIQTFEPWPLPRPAAPSLLRQGGCYLITGGRGRIGTLIADWLAATAGANLVLVGRSAASADVTTRLESLGIGVLNITADAADEPAMGEAIREARARFGRIDGVVHAAGLTDDRGFLPFEETNAALAGEHFRAKAASLLILESLLRDDPPSLWLLVSSLSAILGGLGMAAYAGANAYLDAFATAHHADGGAACLSVDWDGWDFADPASSRAVTPQTGLDLLERLTGIHAPPQVIVSVGDLHARLEQWIALRSIREPRGDSAAAAASAGATPSLAGTETEQTIGAIWQELLGARNIQPHDNFFELGGHSLLAIQLISRLRDAFHLEVSVQRIFEAPTLAGLAARIDAQRTEEESARLEQMVALVEGLSDDEIRALLGGAAT